MNGRFYMILILDKNISQYMQGSALHKHRTFYIAISPLPHSRLKFGILPVWQNHLCLHKWNTDGELSRILCIQSTLKETGQQNFSVI
jgi:hypothetical protein